MPRDSKTPLSDTTLVCVFRNRTKEVTQSLKSWVDLGFAKILLWDYGSSTRDFLTIGNVFYHFDAAPRWHLSRAANRAISTIDTRFFFKIDSDVQLLARPSPPSRHVFRTGRWQRNVQHEHHCNGSVFIETAAFNAVGGYDEHIKSYGWDDEDLYQRLERSGMRRRFFLPNTLYHHAHSDSLRANDPALYLIERNKMAAEVRNVSRAKHDLASFFEPS